MNINELPEECLLIIFNKINDLDDLFSCFKVCNKWSYLISERTKHVECLLDGSYFTSKYVDYKPVKPVDGECLTKLFPNLKVAEFSNLLIKNTKHEDMVTLIKNIKPLKGLIYLSENDEDSLFQYFDKLEMVASRIVGLHLQEIGMDIKQLYLPCSYLDDFKQDAHHFPNLERLHIEIEGADPDQYYHGPVLSNLKIIELSYSSFDGTPPYYGFQFMDSCPNLQSAHIMVDSADIFIDESVKHDSLQDLVIEFFYNDRIHWNELKRLFMKYPNLKHLSLRNNHTLQNRHVVELVHTLPNLELLDVCGSMFVNQHAANYVQSYAIRYRRSIKFYFNGNRHEIISDWPQLSTSYEKISQGFDFMKNCFFKSFDELSAFLISSDD